MEKSCNLKEFGYNEEKKKESYSMRYIVSILIGYLLGTLSPAAFFGKLKKVNMKEVGSKNLGASNAWITLGKKYFFIIMFLDIGKSWLAAQIAWMLFPETAVIGYVASLGAILGHIFPFYLHFKGGKGLASFGGMTALIHPLLLAFYLIFGFALTQIAGHTWVMPFMMALSFPFVVWFRTKSIAITAVATVSSVVILIMHWSNMVKAFNGTDFNARKVVRDRFTENKKEK